MEKRNVSSSTRPHTSRTGPSPPESIFEAFVGGLQYGAVELGNSYLKTFSFGHYDLEEVAADVAANNFIGDDVRNQTRGWADISANAAMGAASSAAIGGALGGAAKTNLAGQLGKGIGQGANVAGAALAPVVHVGSAVANARSAIDNAAGVAESFANGDVLAGLNHSVDLLQNVAGLRSSLKFAKPHVESVLGVGHHTVPRAVLKQLRPNVANDPLVRGSRGKPNIKDIPDSVHRKIHSSPPGKYFPGGQWNRRFTEEIRKRGGFKRVSPAQIDAIRNKLIREFKL